MHCTNLSMLENFHNIMLNRNCSCNLIPFYTSKEVFALFLSSILLTLTILMYGILSLEPHSIIQLYFVFFILL